MKTAIRKWLLARKIRKLAQTLHHLHQEADLNRVHQDHVAREMTKVAAQLMDQDIRARREMADA